MIKHVKFKKLGRKALPKWCLTTVVTDKQGKNKQTQVWGTLKEVKEAENVDK